MTNAEKGLAYACEQTGAEVLEYTAAPVFMDDNAKCRHQWLIEFSKEPADLDKFTELLDKKLQEINSDYDGETLQEHHAAASGDSKGAQRPFQTTGSSRRESSADSIRCRA